jgi:glycosyltransferase involved in cell wall biosynthesis
MLGVSTPTTAASPDVSVVIPTRNRCPLLEQAVSSVLAQAGVRLELIVVDDGSDDGTAEWLGTVEDDRLRTIRLEESGERCHARNMGLEAAEGRFILFLDDDDLLPASALAAHLRALQAHPSALASVGGCRLFSDAGQERTVRIARRLRVRHVWEDILFGWTPISGQFLLQTDVVRSSGGWDGAFIPAEDHDLWLRIADRGPFVLLPDVVNLHRVHPGQWRPADLEQMMTEIRQRAVDRRPGSDQRARGILRARDLAHRAWGHYAHFEARAAFALYLECLRTSPGLLRSPLIRPTLVAPMLKCLVGGPGLRLGQRLLAWWRGADHELDSMRSAQIRPAGERAVPPNDA